MRYIWILLPAMLLASCGHSADEEAAPLLEKIETLYSQGAYAEVLDSIAALRINHPTALKARRRALELWQDASLALAQTDIAKTDSALQATLQLIDREPDLYTANMLRVKRDSLKARYEAMCGVVRIIHIKQKERGKDVE